MYTKKQKFENIKEDKHKHMMRCRQDDTLEQWVMHRADKDEVLGSSLGSQKTKSFFPPLNISVIQIKHSYLFDY